MRAHVFFLMAGFTIPSTVLAQAAQLSTAPAQTAHVVAVQGAVEVTAPGSATAHSATVGEALTAGTRLRSGDAAIARVTLPNGAVLTVLPGAQLTMFGSSEAPATGTAPSTSTTLEAGTVRVSAAPPGASVVPVTLGATTVSVGRGDATLSAVRGAPLVRVAVQRGRMLVRTMGIARGLRAGQGVRENAGPTRSFIVPLAAAPTWRQVPIARVASLHGADGVFGTFSLAGATGLTGWRVDVARDAEFHDLVSSERLPARPARWDAHIDRAGSYHVRVAAIDGMGLEGAASAGARFVVEMPSIVPGAAAEGTAPARPAMLHVPAGIVCGVDGSALTAMPHPARIRPGRAHQVRCATAANTAETVEFAVPVGEAGPLNHQVHVRVTGGNEGVLGLRLSDLEGNPLPYATVTATGGSGVTLEELREGDQRGAYSTRVRWNGRRDRVQIHFTVNGGVSFVEDVSLDATQR